MKALEKIIVGIIMVGISLATMFIILEKFQQHFEVNSTSYHAFGKIIEALETIPEWLPLLVLVSIAVILISFTKYLGAVQTAEEG